MLQILLYSLIMVVVVEIAVLIMIQFLSAGQKFDALIILVVGALIGGAVYAYLSMKSRLADAFFGSRIQRLREKFVR